MLNKNDRAESVRYVKKKKKQTISQRLVRSAEKLLRVFSEIFSRRSNCNGFENNFLKITLFGGFKNRIDPDIRVEEPHFAYLWGRGGARVSAYARGRRFLGAVDYEQNIEKNDTKTK